MLVLSCFTCHNIIYKNMVRVPSTLPIQGTRYRKPDMQESNVRPFQFTVDFKSDCLFMYKIISIKGQITRRKKISLLQGIFWLVGSSIRSHYLVDHDWGTGRLGLEEVLLISEEAHELAAQHRVVGLPGPGNTAQLNMSVLKEIRFKKEPAADFTCQCQ